MNERDEEYSLFDISNLGHLSYNREAKFRYAVFFSSADVEVK